MKLTTLWRGLTRVQQDAWKAWARNNPMLLDDGRVRRVSGRKAMALVVRNRQVAGAALAADTVPTAPTWLDGKLSLRDAGPFTENAGFVGFRAEDTVASGKKWFVWATPPTAEGLPSPGLRNEAGVLRWTWGGANPVGGWNIYQSNDGGATFAVEELGYGGAAREYENGGQVKPTFIVGLNGSNEEITGRSGVVTPERPVAEPSGGPLGVLPRLRFVGVVTTGALVLDDLVDIKTAYQAACGQIDGPGLDGEWPTPTYVWFKLHHYHEGQLSPGVLLRGQVVVQL